MKIKQDNEKSDDPQNNPMFTTDSLSTEMIQFHSLKWMSTDSIGKKKLAFSHAENRTSEKHCMSNNNQVFL
jgi:hypothetical protein